MEDEKKEGLRIEFDNKRIDVRFPRLSPWLVLVVAFVFGLYMALFVWFSRA